MLLLLGLGAARADSVQKAEVAPTLHWLASRGATFTHAYSNTPWPRAAAATLLTGALSTYHGVQGPLDALSPAATSLARIAAARGYDTVAVVSHADLDPAFGFDRGFARFDARLSLPIVEHGPEALPVPSLYFGDRAHDRSVRAARLRANARRSDAETTEAALGALAKHRGRRLFLWVSYFGASQTWREDALSFWSKQEYEERIQQLDREVQRLLDGLQALGLAERTLVVLYADSGFALLEHGDYGVGLSLYEPAIRIPLSFVWPKRISPEQRFDVPVSLLDVAPTVADLLDWGPLPEARGRSLRPLFADKPSELPERPVWLETFLPATAAASREVRLTGGEKRRIGSVLRGVRLGRYKLIVRRPYALVDVPEAAATRSVGPAVEEKRLFDLLADPGEQRDLVPAAPAVLQELERCLAEFEGSGEKTAR